ncbi:bacterial proteasome activator family protein [Amycolatopsis sp. QT-25]|uniref:bacterial proteasome activator family protein n=1 Tax=Amycolatopsis sp. QT-25 TaxID=3034022 RepID=UPI0023EE0BCB|nr:bacterial proteasome activator family protein [Amycolatopsis sp. QT-25]WET79911.1 bacterial proteasome activator family protein [Amycolatopsis sp. QT-25]
MEHMTDPVSRESNTPGDGGGDSSPHVVVVGPDGTPVGTARVASPGSGEEGAQEESLGDLVEEPAKVMRIGTMIKQLLEEVRAAPLDDASRTRVREIHQTSIRELEQALAPELQDELERLVRPFTENSTPSDAELRIAQAQLVGWLEGLFSGIQTALFAQQMAARVQLEQMRRGLPAGPSAGGALGGHGAGGDAHGPGQYL